MEKGYKRLTPDQPVGLRHAGYVISVQKVIKVSRYALHHIYNLNGPHRPTFDDTIQMLSKKQHEPKYIQTILININLY